MRKLVLTVGGHRYAASLRSIGMLFFVILIFTAYLFIYASRQAGAQTAVFYSSSCLGGWKNVNKAAGAPDIVSGEHAEYSDDNSASVYNTNAEIYCGGFGGEIPDDALKKKVVVRFSWAILGQSFEIKQGEATTETENNAGDDILDQGEVEGAETINIDMAPGTQEESAEIENTSGSQETPVVEEAPAEQAPEPEPESEPELEPAPAEGATGQNIRTNY